MVDAPQKFHFIVCAVLFGCDDSLVGLDLGEGITIARKSLIPNDQCRLDEIFETDAVGLRREYDAARLNHETLDVACIDSNYEFTGTVKAAKRYFDQKTSELFTYLDDQIRTIRLLLEGPVRYKKLAIKMESEHYKLGVNDMCHKFSWISPIGEAYGVTTIQKAHCDDIEQLRLKMDRISFPLCKQDDKYKYINQAHMFYDRSYLVTLYEAEVLLITSLEILFLDSEKGKKQRLSKRCTTFLCESQYERAQTYKKLCEEYKKRSDYVHDGSATNISQDDVIFLRKCVRKSILKLLESPMDKKDLIKKLQEKIQSLDDWKSS
ncbi:MAG: hypothetical protein ACFWTN_07745 [Clostridium sp.]|jgi:hypothetical protein